MIVFGLGNPGPKYSKSRHNVGFMAIEKLAAQEGLSLRKRCLHSYKWARKGSLTLVEPLTFMNNSGIIFPHLVKGEDRVVVIVDNMDLPVGRIRIRQGGSAAGHNGLKSIINNIGADFIRLYIGIAKSLRLLHCLLLFLDNAPMKDNHLGLGLYFPSMRHHYTFLQVTILY